MPKNDETNASGQAGVCDCLGCRIRALIVPDEKNPPTGDEVREALDSLSRNVVGLILQYSRSPERSAETFVRRFSDHLDNGLLMQASGVKLH